MNDILQLKNIYKKYDNLNVLNGINLDTRMDYRFLDIRNEKNTLIILWKML